jgi:hypothetical protein
MAAADQQGPHFVSFGSKDANDRSATNIDPAAEGRGTTVTVNNIGAASSDEVLDIAVREVQKLPVAAL